MHEHWDELTGLTPIEFTSPTQLLAHWPDTESNDHPGMHKHTVTSDGETEPVEWGSAVQFITHRLSFHTKLVMHEHWDKLRGLYPIEFKSPPQYLTHYPKVESNS
jgi:hypothetical protein